MAQSKKNGAGKGDGVRPYNKQKYDENFDRIFSGKKKVFERHAEALADLYDSHHVDVNSIPSKLDFWKTWDTGNVYGPVTQEEYLLTYEAIFLHDTFPQDFPSY